MGVHMRVNLTLFQFGRTYYTPGFVMIEDEYSITVPE
jgi:hypothetical protein